MRAERLNAMEQYILGKETRFPMTRAAAIKWRPLLLREERYGA